jgi:hypothetical protein
VLAGRADPAPQFADDLKAALFHDSESGLSRDPRSGPGTRDAVAECRHGVCVPAVGYLGARRAEYQIERGRSGQKTGKNVPPILSRSGRGFCL